jgi:hypothetical protein
MFLVIIAVENVSVMKWLMMFLGWMIAGSVAVTAQDYKKVYSVANRTALDIYFMASEFAANKNMVYSKDPVNNSVQIEVTIPYNPNSNDCVSAMDLKGRVMIQSKDGKTRIIMDSLTYVSHETPGVNVVDTQALAKTAVIPASGPACAPSGQVQKLYGCVACSQSINNVKSTLQTYFDQVSKAYENYLRTEMKTSGL